MTTRQPQNADPQNSPSQPLGFQNLDFQNLDTKQLGNLGEQLVSQWLLSKNCQILHRQWHSRFGEIDLIAKGQSGQGTLRCEMLAFIEVKTRSQGNWDADGLLSVTRSKQTKLRTTARYFLVRHPHLSELPCRFDIALVSCHTIREAGLPSNRLTLPVPNSDKYLRLQRYMRDAF
ncbi:MAG: YraN family protein [Cyanobacteria bacterium P01_F01_bin.53]